MAKEHDMIVVGAGWYGLAAAKVYIELHPTEDIVCLEASSSCGGTWAKDRIYPGLKSNNLVDAYEYPGFPMSEDVYGVKPKEHIPGAVLHRYLTDYAKKFGVFSRMQFNTRVESVTPNNGGWTVSTTSSEGSKTLHTRKIILATGLTSSPNFPQYPGVETFGGPVFHAKDFYKHGETVKTLDNVTVVGGAKSAFDVSWAYVDAGAKVDVVIRPDGQGPVWMSHPWVMGGGKRLEKLLQVRFLTWFSPCPWIGEDGWSWPRKFLHGTAIGRFIVNKFWATLMSDVVGIMGWNSHPETKKLHPWNPVFWIGSGLSIHNYDSNLYEMVKQGKVRIHVANVDHLSDHTVHLSTGESLKSDAVVCATGWKKEPSIKFINFGDTGIGLKNSPAQQKQLAAQADEQVLTMFPRLKDQPTLRFTPKSDPFRLYRFIIPPTRMAQRNIAFAGLVSTTNTAIAAYVQALWISAFLDGKLERVAKTDDEVTNEVMLHTQWCKWRHPTGYGANLPDMAFDALPYVDLLVNDMGLDAVRKKGGYFDQLFSPHGPPDWATIVEEWQEKNEKHPTEMNGKA